MTLRPMWMKFFFAKISLALEICKLLYLTEKVLTDNILILAFKEHQYKIL